MFDPSQEKGSETLTHPGARNHLSFGRAQLAAFCSSSRDASTSSLCVFTSTLVHTLRTTPLGSIRNVCRADSFATPRFITESYFAETSLFVSASSLKVRLSFAQNSWFDFSSCMLTPRITAFFASYLARSRWKLCASIVQPVVMSFG